MTPRARLILDLALFAVLLVAYNPSWTGLAIHEWLCAAAVVPLLFHVITNWDWVLRVVHRFGERLRTMPRVNLVVDAGLFAAAVSVMTSGLMVSRAIAGAVGLTFAPDATWARVHSWSADATVALLLVHFALHWRWVVSTARRLGGRPRGLASQSPPWPAAGPLPAVLPPNGSLATAALVTAPHPPGPSAVSQLAPAPRH